MVGKLSVSAFHLLEFELQDMLKSQQGWLAIKAPLPNIDSVKGDKLKIWKLADVPFNVHTTDKVTMGANEWLPHYLIRSRSHCNSNFNSK